MDNPVTEVLAWGATMAHQDKTTGEGMAMALLQFAGDQLAIIESAWIEKGSMQLWHEFVGSGGCIATDSSWVPVRGYVEYPVGCMVEKSDNDTVWVCPVPEQTRA